MSNQTQKKSEIIDNQGKINLSIISPSLIEKKIYLPGRKLSDKEWRYLFENDLKKFKLELMFRIEDSCKKHGIIKKENGFEIWRESAELFIKRQMKGIRIRYKRELLGKREPFFTGPLGFERAVRVNCYKRSRTFYRKDYEQGIYKNLSKEEYIFSLQCDSESIGETPRFRVDVARPVDNSCFGEPVSGFNRMPDSIMKEKEFKMVFEKEHNNLKSQGKDGPLYFKTIEFYRDGEAEGLTKRAEITELSQFLGVGRKRASEIKCRARKLLFHGISKYFPLEEQKKHMENKLELAKRFKKKSIKKLLEIYDKRHSRFLDPYIDEKEPRLIRNWKVIKGGSGQDQVDQAPESGIQNFEAINDDIAA